MTLEDFLEEIKGDVIDILATNFDYLPTTTVPNRSDTGLTFGRGELKKGKLLKTCVLYVDVRNSVDLTEKHSAKTMGKVYTTFAKSMVKTAKQHNGHVRNIIGDRVMIVFPTVNCFVNAINCAITINHIASRIINVKFPLVDFKCGIGIDYGDLKIIKVGRHIQGTEAQENRSLVWTGYPANIASRLTDVANKTYEETYFNVVQNPYNYYHSPLFRQIARPAPFGLPISSNQPEFLDKEVTVKLTSDEFMDKITLDSGILRLRSGNLFGLSKVVSFTKEIKKVTYPPILITEAVYNGYKNAFPNADSIKKNYFREQIFPIKNVKGKVYGGGVIWKFNK